MTIVIFKSVCYDLANEICFLLTR